MTDVEPSVPFFKKKGRGRPTNNRQRSASPPRSTGETSSAADPSSSARPSAVVLPSKRQGGSVLSAGTKRKSSQRDDAGLDDVEDEREGPGVNWTAKGSHQQAAQDIIAGDELEALEAKRLRRDLDAQGSDDEGPDDGLYHGKAGYKSHLKKNQEVPKAMRVGPQRSSGSTIRTVTITDYQPDVCKDYKETGYCGFGDTCKFLHDRGTYMAGWQLDKLAAQPKKQVGDADSSDDDSDDEDIPFACLICRNPYTDPVVTRCGHYYCAACAIKRYAKTPKCLACGAPTGGIFNRADKVIEKLKKKREETENADDEDASNGNAIELEGIKEANDDEGSE